MLPKIKQKISFFQKKMTHYLLCIKRTATGHLIRSRLVTDKSTAGKVYKWEKEQRKRSETAPSWQARNKVY